MDIQGWLADVEDLALPEENILPSFKRRREKRQHSPPPRYRSTSSDTQTHSSSASSSSSSSSASSTSKEAPVEIFERRKRHRTRTDLYEPHSGVRKKRSKKKDDRGAQDNGKKSKKSKRKSRNERTPGEQLVKSFRTSKVGQNRITLRPTENVGMFKRGRASSPVTGRGLPDLAFSEMRFLQKPKNQDESRNVEDPTPAEKRKNKNDGKNRKIEEISSYFTENPSAAQQKRPHGRETSDAKGSHDERHGNEQRHQPRTSEQDRERSCNVLPTIELPAKPFLGFGSRGSRPESAGLIPWSTSPAQRHKPISETHQRPRTGTSTYRDVQADDVNLAAAPVAVTAPQATLISALPTPADQVNLRREAQPKTTEERIDMRHAIQEQRNVTLKQSMCQQPEIIHNSSSSPMKRLLAACDQATAVPKPKQDAYQNAQYVSRTETKNPTEYPACIQQVQEKCRGRTRNDHSEPERPSRHHPVTSINGYVAVEKHQHVNSHTDLRMDQHHQYASTAPMKSSALPPPYDTYRRHDISYHEPMHLHDPHDDRSARTVCDNPTQYHRTFSLGTSYHARSLPFAKEQSYSPARLQPSYHLNSGFQATSTESLSRFSHIASRPSEQYRGTTEREHDHSRYDQPQQQFDTARLDPHRSSNAGYQAAARFDTDVAPHPARYIHSDKANTTTNLHEEDWNEDYEYKAGMQDADVGDDIMELGEYATGHEGTLGPLQAYFHNDADHVTNQGSFWRPNKLY